MTATNRASATSCALNGPPSRKSNSRIRQYSASVRRSCSVIFCPPRNDWAAPGFDAIDNRSTPGRFLAYRSSSRYPGPEFHELYSPNMEALRTVRVRSWFTSGGYGAKA